MDGGAKDQQSMEFTIPSDRDAIRDTQDKIMSAVHVCHFNEDDVFAIRLALQEGLINAAKHGNKFDSSKKIHVIARVSPVAFDITIEDEGGGFARESVPDPRLDENLEKAHGRGLLLIEAYMDRVEYSQGGRKLHMIKHRQNGVH